MKLSKPTLLCTSCISLCNPINVIIETCTSDTCFVIYTLARTSFFAITPYDGVICLTFGVSCHSRPRLGNFTYIYLTTIQNINFIIPFINANKQFNGYVDINNASNILFHKKVTLTENCNN